MIRAGIFLRNLKTAMLSKKRSRNGQPELRDGNQSENLSEKQKKNEASYRDNTTRQGSELKEIRQTEGAVGHPERIRTLPCHEIG